MNKGSEEDYDPFGPFNLNDFKNGWGIKTTINPSHI